MHRRLRCTACISTNTRVRTASYSVVEYDVCSEHAGAFRRYWEFLFPPAADYKKTPVCTQCKAPIVTRAFSVGRSTLCLLDFQRLERNAFLYWLAELERITDRIEEAPLLQFMTGGLSDEEKAWALAKTLRPMKDDVRPTCEQIPEK